MRDLGFRGSLRLWLLWLVRAFSSLLGLLGCSISWGAFRLAAVRGGPEGEVIPEELHDEGAVTVRLLGQ